MDLPQKLTTVIAQFKRLPGVGEKTATRYALTLTNWFGEDLKALGESLKELAELKKCVECGVFSDQDLCLFCQSSLRRESGLICVVESISDCLAIERSKTFSGLYHVLGGVLNPLLGIGPENLRIEKLIERINHLNIREVILALNPSVEGDATCAFLKQKIDQDVRVERIGFGMPVGGSLEHLDPLTINKALENRKEL